MATIAEMLTSAVRDHQAGRSQEAESTYRAVLQFEPNHPDALHCLGLLCHETGRSDQAEELLQQALRIQPNFADAYFNLGIVLQKLGKVDEAVSSYHKALTFKPAMAEAHFNLGNTFLEEKRLPEAEAAFREAIRLRPTYFKAYNNLGMVLQGQDRLEEEVAILQHALRLRPDYASALSNLGNALHRQGKVNEAIAHCEKAVRLEPNNSQAYNNLGAALLDQGKVEEARACIEESLRLKPGNAKALNNLGAAYTDLGRLDEAITTFQEALRTKPDNNDAHWNHGLVQLLRGNFPLGWDEYEYRIQGKKFDERKLQEPLWDGSPLAGRTILVHAEQGLGDTLHFIRYAPLVKARGGTVIVECQAPLLPILASCPGIDRLMARGSPLPPFDIRINLMSLPKIFGTDLDTVPADVPYLAADEHLVEHWRSKLSYLEGFKVGISWQGNPKNRKDHLRSIPLAEFAPLARVPGIQVLSLQKGFGAEQISGIADRFAVTDLGSHLDEASGAFMDTAAVMKNLDLFITTDTATAHLAGALGVPVWLALSSIADWRWLEERSDSPWYPTMRLFRQKRRGDWSEVFERIMLALREIVGAPASVRGASTIRVDVAPGELIDKITILLIKSARITDAAKLTNVHTELALLTEARDRSISPSPELNALTDDLKAVNEQLWDIEDAIRLCEREDDFGPRFIELARSVYRSNDQRAALKRRVNDLLGSTIVEEKSYAEYQ